MTIIESGERSRLEAVWAESSGIDVSNSQQNGRTYTILKFSLSLQIRNTICSCPTPLPFYNITTKRNGSIYELLFRKGNRSYTHQLTNIASSTIAQISRSDDKAITFEEHPEIDFSQQLETKINRMIHSHFIALILFYESERKSYSSVVEQTNLQFGQGLAQGRQGLHSSLLPGLTITGIREPIRYQQQFKVDYAEYLFWHLREYQKICQHYSQVERDYFQESHENVESHLELLALDPFNFDEPIHCLGLTIKKNRADSDIIRNANELFDRLQDVRKKLIELKELLESIDKKKSHPSEDQVETIQKLSRQTLKSLEKIINKKQNFLLNIQFLMTVTCPVNEFINSHLYAEFNRTDDLPGSLNDWDGCFLEREFRNITRNQLEAASKGAPPEELAEQFVTHLQRFLQKVEEEMDNDINHYEKAKKAFPKLQEAEKNLFDFFRKEELEGRPEEGFLLIRNLFNIFMQFSEDIEVLSNSHMTPARQIAKEIMKFYKEHKKNLLDLCIQLYHLNPKEKNIDTIRESFKKETQFNEDQWRHYVTTFREGNKAPWTPLMGNIQKSTTFINFNPFEALGNINTALRNLESIKVEDTKLLPEMLFRLEHDSIIPYPARYEIQKMCWVFLVDHVNHLIEKPRDQLTPQEKVFVDLLDISNLDLNIKHKRLLEGPYLLSHKLLTNTSRSITSLQECIKSIERLKDDDSEPEGKKKENALKCLKTLQEKYPRTPPSKYEAHHELFKRLIHEIDNGDELEISLQLTIDKLKLSLGLVRNSAKKTAKNIRHKLKELRHDDLLNKVPVEGKNVFQEALLQKAKTKIGKLIAFQDRYRIHENFQKDIESGEFFLNAAKIEYQYPGSIHPYDDSKDVFEITTEDLIVIFGRRLQGLIKKNDRDQLSEFSAKHKLYDHEIVEELYPVLMNAVTETFNGYKERNDLEGLQNWIENLRTYYTNLEPEEFKPPEQLRYLGILCKRFELANRLIPSFQALVNEQSIPVNMASHIRKMINNPALAETIINGTFFKDALMYFTKRIEVKYPGGNLETHEGIPMLWNRIWMFLSLYGSEEAENHLFESVTNSIEKGNLGNIDSLDDVEKNDCLEPNPFQKYGLAMREFGEIRQKVIPYYRQLISEFAVECDYNKLMKELAVAELPVNKLYHMNDYSKRARKILLKLPMKILSSLLMPTILTRTHNYEYVDDDDRHYFQSLVNVPRYIVNIIESKKSLTQNILSKSGLI